MQNGDEKAGMLSAIRHYWQILWRFTLTGMLVWAPLTVTIWISWWLIGMVGGGLDRLFSYLLDLVRHTMRILAIRGTIPFAIEGKGLGLITAVILFFLTGILARYLIGRKIIDYGESILIRIPLISKIYRAVQQIRDVFIRREGAVFQYVCLVDYPRKGMTAFAFVTSHEQGVVQQAKGCELVALFVPTTPNPTSGYLIYVTPEEITRLDMTVEEGMKVIVSGGAYLPSQIAPQEANAPAPAETRTGAPERADSSEHAL